MKRITAYILFFCLLFSCEKAKLGNEKINFHTTGSAKVKTRYIFARSTDSLPYTFTSYSYDQNWNLLKELISDYPKPAWSSFTYKYSDNGELIIKDHWVKIGENFPDQKESDFSLTDENKYSYQDNKKIEKVYWGNVLHDCIIYTYLNNNIISEYHYDMSGIGNWNVLYDFDSNDRLIKITSNPDGFYTVYTYDGSKIQKTSEYNRDNQLIVENSYVYTHSNINEIVEIYYKGPIGEFLSDKITYSSGNVIEEIQYDPYFNGVESYCKRYEYY
jgi:hypothetical protein